MTKKINKKAIFLDRDGVINEDFGYVCKIENFHFRQGVFETLSKFTSLGYKIVIVTNQSGIGRGYYTLCDFENLTKYMLEEFEKNSIKIDKVCFCPHSPEQNCDCRKPKPKMILDASIELGIDLQNSIMVGDKKTDIIAGKSAGVGLNFLLDGKKYKNLDDIYKKVQRKDVMQLNINRVVITGGAGFIGSSLARYFDKHYKDIEVLVVDKFRNNETFSNKNLKSFGHYKNLLGFNGEIFEGDINCKSTLKKIKNFKPDVIFHQAAISDTTVVEQDEVMETNVNAFVNLLDICKRYDIKMVYASSAATYGNAKSPQVVDECEKPNNVYGFSKLSMDNIAKKYSLLGVYVVGLRYFNVYGKGEFYKNKTASMVLQLGLQILSGNSPKLFEGSDKIKRDFVYIKDIVDANIKSINSQSGVYNVATGEARSFEEIVKILQKNLNTNLQIEYIKNPYIGSYQFHTQADIKPTMKALGYKSNWSLEDGIKDYIGEIKRIYKDEING